MPGMPGWSPPGSELIAGYAMSRRLAYDPKPGEDFFRRWEPHDTMVSPELWYNACTQPTPWGGHVTIAEPWTAGEACEPLERTLVAFTTAGWLTRRAAMRVGEPFLTKVAFLEAPPPPTVTIGDKVWDEHVTTFAASSAEAQIAFPKPLRDLLRRRGFRGHFEVRPHGFITHEAGLAPRPEAYDILFRLVYDIAAALRNTR
jgi:hypothetical protein